MSMPKFPDIDPEMTCDRALNMILVSIAMEEMALSHILNAEGEKLQYVLGTLETGCGRKATIDEVLDVNKSITSLVDSITQNQMILKNKLDKALSAMETLCPEHPKPGCKCPCKCSAVFKEDEECGRWCAGFALHWKNTLKNGKCVHLDACDKTKICLQSNERFLVSFVINVKTKSDCHGDAAICLQMINDHHHEDVVTVHSHFHSDKTVTFSSGGVIVQTPEHASPSFLSLKLISRESLVIEDAELSIVKI